MAMGLKTEAAAPVFFAKRVWLGRSTTMLVSAF